MKTVYQISTLLFFLVLGLTNCSKERLNFLNNTTGARLTIPQDSSLYNNEADGKFLYTHLKYYLGTVDLLYSLPEEQRKNFKKQLSEQIDNANKHSHDEVIDDLVNKKYFTSKQGNIVKGHIKKLKDYLTTRPQRDDLFKWGVDRENEVRNDNSLTIKEKQGLLSHQALLRYALKWKLEQMTSTPTGGRIAQTADFWNDLACWVGTISGVSGLGGSMATSVAWMTGSALSAAANFSVLGAAVGIGLGIVNAVIYCTGNPNKNVCQDPVTVSTPYKCYSPGDNLLFEAVGYGNSRPDQFVFSFTYNNNLYNNLYSDFTTNDYLWLPSSYLLNYNPSSIAVNCKTSCSNGNPLWFGWFVLSDLGRPYFTITGNSNLYVSDLQAMSGSSQTTNYDAVGMTSGASILWEIIPSGYPNYSATGTIMWGQNGFEAGIRWDPHPGFATVKCTINNYCGTPIVNTYTVHIN